MKKKIIIFAILIFLLFSFFSYKFILNAREKRTWPFNSSIGLYLPQWVKYYAYKYTNKKPYNIITQFYKIELNYYNIPYSKSVGGGGAINQINNDTILLTLNDGTNFKFNIKNKSFIKISNTLEKKYTSIRDVFFESDRSEIYLLATIVSKPDCKKIILDKYKFKLNTKKTFDADSRIWESEELCNNPMENNGGGRIIKLEDDLFISTGFFAQNINSGIYEYPQNPNSSFGKIIRIFFKDNQYYSEIFSKGHRNPQGLFISKKQKNIYSTEHGPQGGDELNLILPGKNYGWPCITYGAEYSYNFKKESKIWPDIRDLEKYGCKINNQYEPPIFSWSPSIGASQGLEYSGLEFPEFENNFLVSSLKATSIFRFKMLNEKKIVNYEKIFINERIRDLIVLNDGKILIYTDGGNLVLMTRS